MKSLQANLFVLSIWVLEAYGALRVHKSFTGDNTCPAKSTALVSKTNELLQRWDSVSSGHCGDRKWTKVAHLDMRGPGSVCPTNWTLHTSPVRGCGQTQNATTSCDSAIFSVRNQVYSKVCGKVLAYQKGSTDAFHTSVAVRQMSIDIAYVDGISITHGPVGSRQHIWTLAAACYKEDPSYKINQNCPCTNTRYSWPYQLPSFVQNNYFCDTGNSGPGFNNSVYYLDDPLWDGAGCGPHSTCCQFNNPPWFYSLLPQATRDDVEVRLCFALPSHNEDTIVYLVEVYVKP